MRRRGGVRGTTCTGGARDAIGTILVRGMRGGKGMSYFNRSEESVGCKVYEG